MFSHIMIGSNDIARSKKFYDALFGAMGAKPATEDARGRLAYTHNGGRFMVSKPIDGKPASHANGGTIGFLMSSPDQAGLAQSRCREWRQNDRGPARRAPRGGRRDVSRLSARSRRQQTVRALSQAGLSNRRSRLRRAAPSGRPSSADEFRAIAAIRALFDRL